MLLTLAEMHKLSHAVAYLGRLTAKPEGPFVLFLIGASVSSPMAMISFRIWQMLPQIAAMQTMLQELKEKPELGLLHVEQPALPGDVLALTLWLLLLSLLKGVALILMPYDRNL